MKANRILSALAGIVVALTVQALQAASPYYVTTLPPKGGEWNTNFSAAKALADTEHRPLIVFWGNSGCPHCSTSWSNIVRHEEFKQWATDNDILLVYSQNGNSDCPESGKAQAFAGPMGSYPFVRWYWLQEGENPKDPFTKHQHDAKSTGGIGGASLLSKAKEVFADWTPVPKNCIGDFQGADSESARYEVIPTTANVLVNLSRNEKCAKLKTATNGCFVVVSPDGSTNYTQNVSWKVGETNKGEVISFAVPKDMKVGDQLTMYFTDASGVAVATNHVTMIEEPENSPMNPLWFGERTASDLQFGEWTMDLETAKEAVANYDGDAYTLVGIFGSLWCGDCHNNDTNFVNQPEFMDWATNQHKVALVAMDVPQLTGGTNMVPCLLSRETQLKNGTPISGLGYLTRKGITDAEAKPHFDLNVLYAGSNEYFHRPTDGNLYRPDVPTYVLLRKNGTVAARFTTFGSGYRSPKDTSNTANYLKRFDEMIAIAGDSKGEGAHADVAEDANCSPAVGVPELAANGGTATGELCHADSVDTFRLTGMSGNAKITVNVTGDNDEAKFALALWKLENGKATWLGKDATASEKTLKSGELKLEDYPIDGPGDYYVTVANVQNYGNGNHFMGDTYFDEKSATPSNFVSFTVSAGVSEYIPQESRSTGRAAEGVETVPVSLTMGETYRITNLSKEANKDALEPADGENVYVAKKNGLVALKLADPSKEFAYQLWHPGQVGFAAVKSGTGRTAAVTNATTVTEKLGATVVVPVARPKEAGLSGEVSVTVAIDDATDFYIGGDKEYPRFWYTDGGSVTNQDITFTWKEGECQTNFITVGFVDAYVTNKVYYGHGKVVLKIADVKEEVSDATNVAYRDFTVNMKDKDRVEKCKVGFVDAKPFFSKANTVYAKENTDVVLVAERMVNALGEFTVGLKPTLGTLDKDSLTWESFTSGRKEVTFLNAAAAGKSGSVAMSIANGADVVTLATKSVKIQSIAADGPEFLDDDVTFDFYRNVNVSSECSVKLNEKFLEEGDVVSFAKTLGSLPSGIKVEYDEFEKALRLTGAPTATPSKTFDGFAVYQVNVKRTVISGTRKSTKNIPGLTCRISYTYHEPTKNGGGEDGQKALNPACDKSRTIKDIIVIGEGERGKVLDGLLTVTIPSTGKASAKLTCATGTVSFSSKTWSEIGKDGTLYAELLGTGAFKTWAMDLEAHPDGKVLISYTQGDAIARKAVAYDGVAWSATESAEAWQGYYTVALPLPDETYVQEKIDGLAPRGCGYLTFEVKSANFKNGTVAWAGQLANGAKVSGSSVLTRGEGAAYLPMFKQSKTDVFSVVALIEAEAKANAVDFSKRKTVYCPCYEDGKFVFVGNGSDWEKGNVLPAWSHIETTKGASDGSYSMELMLYGGIYDPKGVDKSLSWCCQAIHGSTNMTMTVGGSNEDSGSYYLDPFYTEKYGTFGMPAPLSVSVGETKFTLSNGGANKVKIASFKQATGLLSGSFEMPYSFGGRAQKLSASWTGIVVIGWGTCGICGNGGQPFVNGAWTFTDKFPYYQTSGSRTVKKWQNAVRGGSIDITVKED